MYSIALTVLIYRASLASDLLGYLHKNNNQILKNMAEKKKKQPFVIPPEVMKLILADESIFIDKDKKNDYLRKLKEHPAKVFDELRPQIKTIIAKAAHAAGLHVVVTNELVATRQVIDAMKEKYKTEIEKIRVIYHIAQ
jgi:hypothetical protein